MCLLGLTAIIGGALDLSAYGLAHYVDSDFLTPYFFCADWLSGKHPMSGWTLSASPYFVPDHLVLSSLMSICGPTGFAYALFPAIFYPALFVLAAGCMQTAVGRTAPAAVATLLFGVGFLALRGLPAHSVSLWWLGSPTCHGGVLLLGFAYLWMLGAGLRRGRIGWLPAGLFGVGFAGLLSDTLFLFQVLLPASAVLFLARRRHPDFAPWLRWQGAAGLAALLCAQLFKPICKLAGWFYFSRILRVAPTPAHQWHALQQFVSDVPELLHDHWVFALVGVIAAALAWRAPRGEGRPLPGGGVQDFYRLFCAASLCVMLPLPILSCGWKDTNNVRYLFNWLVLPGFLLTLELVARWPVLRPRECLAAAAVFLVGGGWAALDLSRQTLAFPYAGQWAVLDTILQRHSLKYGLAQYWDAKTATACSRAGAELRQIRSDGQPYFWDNNAFAYYARGADGKLSWPAYQYILTDGLDDAALARAFGRPQAVETAGNYEVWIYDGEGQRAIRATLEPAVREKLGTRRARLLPPVNETLPTPVVGRLPR